MWVFLGGIPFFFNINDDDQVTRFIFANKQDCLFTI